MDCGTAQIRNRLRKGKAAPFPGSAGSVSPCLAVKHDQFGTAALADFLAGRGKGGFLVRAAALVQFFGIADNAHIQARRVCRAHFCGYAHGIHFHIGCHMFLVCSFDRFGVPGRADSPRGLPGQSVRGVIQFAANLLLIFAALWGRGAFAFPGVFWLFVLVRNGLRSRFRGRRRRGRRLLAAGGFFAGSGTAARRERGSGESQKEQHAWHPSL